MDFATTSSNSSTSTTCCFGTIKVLYKPDGITVCQNGGVFNELTHYHMHVVPRYKERSFAEFYMVQPAEKQNHNL
ncbi:hypothetical protein ACT4UT_37660, partial [Bacillus sp. B-TM1]